MAVEGQFRSDNCDLVKGNQSWMVLLILEGRPPYGGAFDCRETLTNHV